MIDVGKCWLSNYDNRTKESVEKSKLTSAFPELLSESISAHLDHGCETSWVQRKGFFQRVVYYRGWELDFLSWYRGEKKHSYLLAEFWSIEKGSLTSWEMSGALTTRVVRSWRDKCTLLLWVEWWGSLLGTPTCCRKENFPPGRDAATILPERSCLALDSVQIQKSWETILTPPAPSPSFLVWRESLQMLKSVSFICCTVACPREVLCMEI